MEGPGLVQMVQLSSHREVTGASKSISFLFSSLCNFMCGISNPLSCLGPADSLLSYWIFFVFSSKSLLRCRHGFRESVFSNSPNSIWYELYLVRGIFYMYRFMWFLYSSICNWFPIKPIQCHKTALPQSQFGFSVLDCFQASLILSKDTGTICVHGAALMCPFQVAYGLWERWPRHACAYCIRWGQELVNMRNTIARVGERSPLFTTKSHEDCRQVVEHS